MISMTRCRIFLLPAVWCLYWHSYNMFSLMYYLAPLLLELVGGRKW